MGTITTRELGTIHTPVRTLDQIRRDLMALEREVAHHALVARACGHDEDHDYLSDAQVGMHQSALALGRMVDPR